MQYNNQLIANYTENIVAISMPFKIKQDVNQKLQFLSLVLCTYFNVYFIGKI